ncbi:fatty acid desaturase [Chitinimonas viridis]|uniref:Fatty acid desaturase n=2 Tax=Chitinimonas TaxID=240411 RepID=A0ABT8B0R5_9NEIS|nr:MULTISPECIES: fatty acid desaturase [Chitinimonas]MDN3575644.1 fatty acid desaturase [Chitinimonas viridis]GLR11399.1 acyl-CoA desaturase [Chitinimonas prasina]
MSKSLSLNPDQLAAFGAELDALRNRHLAELGEADARYIRRVRASVRITELAGRLMLFAGFFPPTWCLGVLLLAFSKIVDNMELGHNVMHGQYDFMNDPEFSGKHFEWDHSCTSDAWRRTHNYQHHTYTNVLGKDHDIGYGTVRIFAEQRWRPFYLLQPLWALLQAVFFEYAIAVFDLKLDRYLRGRAKLSELKVKAPPVLRKLWRKFIKDYVFFPLIAGPHWLAVLAGNAVANLLRNLWTFTVIFCGHFTEDAEVFPLSVLKDETRGGWYVRQLRGSSNLSGSRWLHFLTGNLSHQIEHHLFPDIPARRYASMAVEVREICQRYGQHYNTGSFAGQFFTVLVRLFRHAFPSRPAMQPV